MNIPCECECCKLADEGTNIALGLSIKTRDLESRIRLVKALCEKEISEMEKEFSELSEKLGYTFMKGKSQYAQVSKWLTDSIDDLESQLKEKND